MGDRFLVFLLIMKFLVFFDRFLVSFWAPLGALLGSHLGPLGGSSWPKFGPRGLSEHDFSKKVILSVVLCNCKLIYFIEP